MTQAEHPTPGPWGWWASFDGGEHMELGPCATREEIIAEALHDERGKELQEDGTWISVFEICQAQENHVDLARYFDVSDFLDRAREAMDDGECGADENGERHPLDEISRDLQHDLEKRIEATIRAWQKEHQLKLRSYWFSDSSIPETIKQVRPDTTETT